MTAPPRRCYRPAVGGADPASPEGGRLEALLTLADAYEEVRHAMPPSDPISAILFMMEQRGLTQIGGRRRDASAPLSFSVRLPESLPRPRQFEAPLSDRKAREILGLEDAHDRRKYVSANG